MKIKITLVLSVCFALGLSAQKQHTGMQNAMNFEMSHVLPSEAVAIDTLVPYPAGCDSALYLTGSTNGGYVMGTNGYGDLEKAQLFPTTGSGTVTDIMVFFGAKEIVGTPDNITAKIYSGTGAGGPTTLLGTSDPVSVTNVDTSGAFTVFTFNTPVSYSGDFFASIEVGTGNDTVGIIHTGTGCLANAWEMWSDNSWSSVDAGWGGFDVSMIMFAVVDDQLGGACPPPTAVTISNEGCDSAEVSWTTSGTGPSILEYGPTGFVPGSGTVMMEQSPFSLTGLSEGADYDVYLTDTCGTDTSTTVGPVSFTTLTQEAAFTYSLGTATLGGQPVDFDASTSQGATSYSWDFDDGNTGSGVTVQHVFTSNGTYNVCLAIEGACGLDTICETVLIEDVSIGENALSRSLSVFPNPTTSDLHITAEGSGNITLRLRSLSGKELKVKNYENLNNLFEGILDLSDLPKGVYLLEVKNGENSANRRIMKR